MPAAARPSATLTIDLDAIASNYRLLRERLLSHHLPRHRPLRVVSPSFASALWVASVS